MVTRVSTGMVDGLTGSLAGKQADLGLTGVVSAWDEGEAATTDKAMAPAAVVGAIAALGGGAAVDVQTFDASGTWTKPEKGSMALIECWGAGGSGARRSGSRQGGGGGGYSCKLVPLSTLGATETVTVGAGGAAIVGTNGDGQDGGDSTFGSHLTGYGGEGGAQSSSGSLGAYKGGGGGPLSRPPGVGTGAGGRPSIVAWEKPGMDWIARSAGAGPGQAARQSGDTSIWFEAMGGVFHGGGGGVLLSGGSSPSQVGRGGDSVYGGGGGGAGSSSPNADGGLSMFGGNGGADSVDGQQPGGGGGAGASASGKGGDGRVRVTVW